MKTLTCSFSGFKIFPGRGIKYVKADCKAFVFFSSKTKRAFLHRANPRNRRWTQQYRTVNKKGQQTEAVAHQRRRKTHKVERAIEGASLDEIRQKRMQRPEARAAAREAALLKIKQSKQAKAKPTSAAPKKPAAPAAAEKAAKPVKAAKAKKAAPVKSVPKQNPKTQQKGR
ncbi:60S ribosomal protein L24 [Pelomyxa schiedti]|nr:60S ribosomal protein L24 [Pelomyxa schiedti]